MSKLALVLFISLYVVPIFIIIAIYLNMSKRLIRYMGETLYNSYKRHSYVSVPTLISSFFIVFTPVVNIVIAMLMVISGDYLFDSCLEKVKKEFKDWGIDFDATRAGVDDYINNLDELEGVKRL